MRQQLLRRVSVQLESLSAFQIGDRAGRDLAEHPLFESLHRDIERGVEKATRRALGQMVLEATNLERVANDAAARFALGSDESPRSARLDFGFHSAMPRIGLTHGVGLGELRYALTLDGNVGLTYRHARLGRMRIHAGFDGDERYSLGCRLGF